MAQEARELAAFFDTNGFPDLAGTMRVVAGAADAAKLYRMFVDQSSTTRQRETLLELEIPTVSEEVYAETRKAVETAIPGVFITSIRPVTMEDLLKEDKQRGNKRRFDYVNDSKTMRAVFPLEMEVFINPQAVRIESSNRLSTDEQKAKIAEAEAVFKLQLPKGVLPYISWHMVDPSTMSQLEDRYMDANNGALLLPNFFARTDIQTVRDRVAFVGRGDPSRRRYVGDWHRGAGLHGVFAVPVGVLPRFLKN